MPISFYRLRRRSWKRIIARNKKRKESGEARYYREYQWLQLRSFITLRVCAYTHIALSTPTHVSIMRKIIAADESSQYRYYRWLTKRRDPDFIDRIKRKKFVVIFWLFPRTPRVENIRYLAHNNKESIFASTINWSVLVRVKSMRRRSGSWDTSETRYVLDYVA